jgi:hypothetical protein
LPRRLERTKISEKMIEDDLSQVEESATKATYKLGIGFKRCEDKSEKSAPKFVPSSNYHKEEESLKSTKTHYQSNPKLSFNPKRGVKKNTPNPNEEVYICMFCDRAGHLDEFCFHHKRMEKRCLDYARNSSCKCFIVKCGSLDKFEFRSFDGILLGYTPHARSYRVFNLETSTVVESYDVTFNETAPCPRDVFKCACDKEMEKSIFIDEELQGFGGDKNEPLLPHHHPSLFLLPHLKQMLLRLLPLPQQ